MTMAQNQKCLQCGGLTNPHSNVFGQVAVCRCYPRNDHYQQAQNYFSPSTPNYIFEILERLGRIEIILSQQKQESGDPK